MLGEHGKLSQPARRNGRQERGFKCPVSNATSQICVRINIEPEQESDIGEYRTFLYFGLTGTNLGVFTRLLYGMPNRLSTDHTTTLSHLKHSKFGTTGVLSGAQFGVRSLSTVN